MRKALPRFVGFGLFAAIVLACGTSLAWSKDWAAPDRITFSIKVMTGDSKLHDIDKPIRISPGDKISVVVTGQLSPKFHTYPIHEELQRSSFTLGKVAGLDAILPIKETPTATSLDKEEGDRVHRKEFTWVQDVVVSPDAKTRLTKLPIKISTTVCDDKETSNSPTCDIIKKSFVVELDVFKPQSVPEQIGSLARDVDKLTDKIDALTEETRKLRQYRVSGNSKKEPVGSVFGLIDTDEDAYSEMMTNWQKPGKISNDTVTIAATDSTADFWAFILGGVFWGAISLITPCVFPMIPITVSIFLKQSEKEHHRPMLMASVYSGTIIVVLTLAAAFMLEVFRYLSVNPVMNYGLGALFVFFALSLFGMYDIELPSGLARFTSAQENKGGVVGTMFMALTFTIISFACVAPFLGGFGGTAAVVQRPTWVNLLGGLAFSTTFAAPFFFLALFPTLLRKMPKSGSWLNSVKVVMGFLELAAAVKFCRSAELVVTGSAPWLLTFDFAIGIYVALSLMAGLYLLGVFRLPHDSPVEHLSVPRLVFAGMFVSLSLYLAPALFHNSSGENMRPRGTLYSWVEAFLLPDSSEGRDTGSLAAAVEKSLEQHEKNKQAPPQRIFIDFTGVTCTNCKINEESVFSKPNIRELMDQYLIVKLYADLVPPQYYSPEVRAGLTRSRQEADAAANLAFQKKIFNDARLPLYAILEPQANGNLKVLAVYNEGRINNETAFAEFLRKPK